MKGYILEIEAETLQKARAEAKSQVPIGLHLLSEQILAPDDPRTAEGIADTVEAALDKARRLVPAGNNIISVNERLHPLQKVVEVRGFDENDASKALSSQLDILYFDKLIDKTAGVDQIKLKATGKKGFLGIGKSPNVYEAKIFQPAHVEVVFQPKAKIRVEIGEVPSRGYCQSCGKSNSTSRVWEKAACFACSEHCYSAYFDKVDRKLPVLMLTKGGDEASFSSGRHAYEEELRRLSRVWCWSCGSVTSLVLHGCQNCGKKPQIRK